MIEEIKLRNGYRIFLDYCEPLNPREEEENLGILYIKGNRYFSGDKNASEPGPDDISLPVYAYIHSEITLNTTGFSCPWDSGQMGFIYVSRNQIREVYQVKKITKTILERVYKTLRAEIETFQKYLNGECYSYRIIKRSIDDDQLIDSCCGYDDLDLCREQALAEVKYFQQQAA